jgi:hypothetical protein
METKKCADIIEKIVAEIGDFRKMIRTKGEAKAKAMSRYDKQLAITLAELGHNENYELSGKEYKQPPITLRKTIAKGIVAGFLEEREIADSDYKSVISNLEALKAQLNGYQSINKYLDSV